MKAIDVAAVTLHENELLRREQENRDYLLSLSDQDLLLNYELEAGRVSIPVLPTDILGGWESPTCQLRGHFLGHWLSAAALQIHATGDAVLKARAEDILRELAACQQDNGGQWQARSPKNISTASRRASRCGRRSIPCISC